jgi:predicted alpha/beta superfamily hydrolase
VHVLRDVESPQLGNTRDLAVYLPPSHSEQGRAFPVVYMHDGQNAAEWRLEGTMDELAREGLEAIVVGIPVDKENRRHEYGQEGAPDYLAFVADTVRPLVEREFAADKRREARGLLGSSLGGVISLHGLYAHPETFGFAGVMSPAFFWNGDDRWFRLVERNDPPSARIYLDVGDRELVDNEELSRRYVEGFERMAALLRARGFDNGSLRAVLDRGGVHHEDTWARRLPDALRFLLPSSR